MQRKTLLVALAAALALTGLVAYAANHPWSGDVPVATVNPAPPAAAAVPASRPSAAAAISGNARGGNGAARVTAADVGDADSFGRNVRWLGAKQAVFGVSTDCNSWSGGDPSMPCTTISAPTGTTTFRYNDLLQIQLPGSAANSLLCHWLAERQQIYFTINGGAAPVAARVRSIYTATIDNPVLQDPGLINPNTGQPFNGSFTTSSLMFDDTPYVVLPNYPLSTSAGHTAVCRGGLVSKQSLISGYGFTPALADKFMKNPTTVHLNVSGMVSNVEDGTFIIGLRMVGD
ncbi:hypothetical protein [Thermomonas sp.]|uniref:hypothetical protein n=1 Tax=Thermomonas sp. TaxID=1971895 RepID=UPI0035AEE056